MATYLVTGCAGFIGAKVTEFLLADGHTVAGVDNLNDAYDVRLKQWRLAQLKGKSGFAFHRLDITDRAALETLFNPQSEIQNPKYDAVINLAARAGVRPSIKSPWVYFDTNVNGTLNLLEMCRQYKVSKFVLASSSSVYGRSSSGPCREDFDTDHPLSPYAASKKSVEALAYSYHYLHEIDVSVLRYFTVYGPAGRPDMMPFRMVQWISEGRPVSVYGDGQQSRDFTYVDDIARGTVLALKPLGYEVVNLGSDRPVVLMDAIHLVEELTGKTAMLEFLPAFAADVPSTWAEIGRADHLLGWRPQVHLRDGLERLVAWYQDNQQWARDIITTE